MAMTILYPVGEHLYVNLTNKCPCACTFCIRQNGDGAYGSDSLWLQHDPSLAEVKKAFEAWNLADFTELVFCGYGEPTEALEILLLTAVCLAVLVAAIVIGNRIAAKMSRKAFLLLTYALMIIRGVSLLLK